MSNIQLYQGDCLNILPTISENIDLVLSDIPYGISYDNWDILHNNTNTALGKASISQLKYGNTFKRRGKPLNGWSAKDKNISKEYYNWCQNWTKELFKIMKPGSSAIIFAGRRYCHKCIDAFEDSGFIFRDMIGWEKNNAIFKAQHVSSVFNRRNDIDNANKWQDWRLGNLRPIFEPILWFMKPYKIGGTIVDNLIQYNVGAFNNIAWQKYSTNNDNLIKVNYDKKDYKLHPTQKPVALMKAFIELLTVENQTILDPFMGSGTTGVACKNTNRNFIGIEKDEKYFNIAKERINE